MRHTLTIQFDCRDGRRAAAFWAEALGYRAFGSSGPYRSIVPPDGVIGPKLVFQEVVEPKTSKNRMHLDIDLDPGADLEAEVARLRALGATLASADPIAEEGMRWYVLRDPEGNEFCVVAA